LITGGVLVVALVAIAALQLLPGSGHSGPAQPGTRTTAGILVPLNGTPANVAFGRFLGRPDAPVHLVVWSDFQCPACKAFSDASEGRLITDYVVPGKLRIEYRDLVVIGPESSAAAAAARCADQQGKFWPYHDVLFANQAPENSGKLTPKRLQDMADALGLDRTKFDSCLPSGDLFNQISAESAQGRTRGDATPILDFGSVITQGSPAYDQLIALAEQAVPFTAFIDPDDRRFLRLADGGLIAAVGAFCRETDQPPPCNPGTLVRVLLESLALKYAWVLRQLAEVSGRSIGALYVVGGGAQNALLCRMTAAAAGLPVLAGPSEATAIGNLIVQAIALGELASLAEARELVARSYATRCYEPTGDWSAARARFDQLLLTGGEA